MTDQPSTPPVPPPWLRMVTKQEHISHRVGEYEVVEPLAGLCAVAAPGGDFERSQSEPLDFWLGEWRSRVAEALGLVDLPAVPEIIGRYLATRGENDDVFVGPERFGITIMYGAAEDRGVRMDRASALRLAAAIVKAATFDWIREDPTER